MNFYFKTYLELCLLALLVLLFLVAEPGANKATILVCLTIFYYYLATAILSPVVLINYIPSFITLKICFLIFCFLLYFMPYQQYIIGLDMLGFSFYVSDTYQENSNLAILSATIAVVGFCIGNRLGLGRKIDRGSDASHWIVCKTLSYIATPFLLALLTLYFGMGWRSAGEGAYTDTSSGGVLADGVVVMILMLSMLISAHSVVLFAATKRIDIMTLFGLSMSVFWALRLLYFGDRNSFILILISAVCPLSTHLFRISRLKILLGLLSLLVIYNVVEVVRSQEQLQASNMYQFFMLTLFENSERESSFNISAITLRATFDLVPEEIDYGFGIYKIIGVLGVVPLFRGIVFGSTLQYDTTAAALTDFVLPQHSGWSVGTGIISDFYIDFGIYGVAFGVLFVGWIGGLVERQVRRYPLKEDSILIYALTVSLFAELPRYSADFPVRIIVWALVVIGLAKLLRPKRLISAKLPNTSFK